MWEYNIARLAIDSDDMTALNGKIDEYGAHGWELVSVQPSDAKSLLVFFKRPKSGGAVNEAINKRLLAGRDRVAARKE